MAGELEVVSPTVFVMVLPVSVESLSEDDLDFELSDSEVELSEFEECDLEAFSAEPLSALLFDELLEALLPWEFPEGSSSLRLVRSLAECSFDFALSESAFATLVTSALAESAKRSSADSTDAVMFLDVVEVMSVSELSSDAFFASAA